LGRNLRNLKEFEELSETLTKWLMLLRVLVLTEPGCPRYTAVKYSKQFALGAYPER